MKLLNFLKKIIVFCVLITTLFVVSPAVANATTYYVDKNTGNDGNNGLTEGAAFSTISRATDLVNPGDEVLVKNGTYNESVFIQRSGTETNPIVVRGFPGDPKPLIVGIGNSDAVRLVANWIEFRGFRITAPGEGNAIAAGFSGANPPIFHHLTIADNVVYDAGCNGIGLQRVDYVTIEDNLAYRNAYRSGFQCSGISIYQARNIDSDTGIHNYIRRNISWSNDNRVYLVEQGTGRRFTTDGNGIILDDFRNTQNPDGTPSYTATTIVENNIVFNNGGRGLHVYESNNAIVRNNTSVLNSKNPNLDGTFKGELTTYFSSNVSYYNNIAIARNSGTFSMLDAYSSNNNWDYNLVSGLINFGDNSTVTPGANNILNTRARFIRVPTNLESIRLGRLGISGVDFRLRPNSPGVDQGVERNVIEEAAALEDIAGTLRPQGSSIDIGAYER